MKASKAGIRDFEEFTSKVRSLLEKVPDNE